MAGILVDSDRDREPATSLGAELGLPILESGSPEAGPASAVLAWTAAGCLELRGPMGTLRVDFLGGREALRVRHGSGRREPLSRALGLRTPIPTRSVLDATAGLGRDAFLLASLGVEVLAAERHPVVGALLRDALERGTADAGLATTLARIHLHIGDGCKVLADLPLADAPDAVYFDPMFPPRRKSSLVKKEMRILAALVGGATPSGDIRDTLVRALAVARRRVVVKRPADAPPIPDMPRPPDLSVSGGRTTRYDVWLCNNQPTAAGD